MSIRMLATNVEIGLVTTNMAPMIEFYENFLGLALNSELAFPGGMQRRYAIGKNILKLVTYDEPPPSRAVPGGGRSQEGIRYLSLFVADIGDVADRIAASPYDIVEPLTEFSAVPGWWWLFVADPDGNWIELAGPRQLDDQPTT